MTQNRSHAVMAQRHEAADSLDDFPTPPWAARALVRHVIIGGGWGHGSLRDLTLWEPAANRGSLLHGLTTTTEWAGVIATDVHDYGCGFDTRDFLMPSRPKGAPRHIDWIITNPPFRLAEQFILRGLEIAREGVAVLVRSSFLEGKGRYETLFSQRKPAIVAPFVERVPMVKGRVDPKASTATAYAWLVWNKQRNWWAIDTSVRWIPPCRKNLERPDDYAGRPWCRMEDVP